MCTLVDVFFLSIWIRSLVFEADVHEIEVLIWKLISVFLFSPTDVFILLHLNTFNQGSQWIWSLSLNGCHIHTHSQSTYWHVFQRREESHGHRENMGSSRVSNLSSGSNHRAWSSNTAPLCYLLIIYLLISPSDTETD